MPQICENILKQLDNYRQKKLTRVLRGPQVSLECPQRAKQVSFILL